MSQSSLGVISIFISLGVISAPHLATGRGEGPHTQNGMLPIHLPLRATGALCMVDYSS